MTNLHAAVFLNSLIH